MMKQLRNLIVEKSLAVMFISMLYVEYLCLQIFGISLERGVIRIHLVARKNAMPLVLAFAFLSGSTLNAATRTTAQTGNYTDKSTWDCNCIPAAGDIVRLEDGDTLTVDSNVTVLEFRYRFGENSTDASRLVVDSTLTITGDFRFEAPFFSNSTANVVINSTGTIDVGDEFRILLSSNENNLTYNIDVDGTLDITTELQDGSGLLSSNKTVNLNINSGGTLTCGTITSTFTASNSEFNLTSAGSTTIDNFTCTMNQANSNINVTSQSGGFISHKSFTFTTNASNSDINITADAGSQMETNGASTLRLDIGGDNSDVRINANDTLTFTNANITGGGDSDTLAIEIGNGGRLRMATALTFRNFGSDASYTRVNLASGGTLRTGTFLDFETSSNGTFDLILNGAYSQGYIDADFRSSSRGTVSIGSSGSVDASNMYFDLSNSGNMAFTNDGSINLSGGMNLIAYEDDTITFNLNDATYMDGRFWMSTSGNNSRVHATLADSLQIGELRMDVNNTAGTGDNLITMTSANAVLSVTSINMDNGDKDASIVSSENGSATTVLRGTSTTDLPIRSTVDYDNLIIANTSSSGVTLDEGDLDTTNFHGDLTINAGATFTQNTSNSVIVQGSATNNSIISNVSGQNFEVQGVFTNNGTYSKATSRSDVIVTGNYINNGTQGNGSGGNYYFGANFTNTGTFEANDGDTAFFNGSSGTQLISGNTTFNDIVASNNASINSGTTSLQGSMQVTGNSTFTTNGGLVFLSNATGTASIREVTTGNSVSGNVTVQRYLDEGNGWYLLASPVTGSTLADWNNELPMSGFTGSDEPTNPWTSVYTYDETTIGSGNPKDSGYVAATNTTNSLVPGEGWFVYFQNVKAGATAKTMDVSGPLQTGTVTVSGLTSSNPPSINERGWHLVGNPYASPVLWSALTLTNIQGSTGYFLQADGTYGDFVNDRDTMFSAEAFWVRTTNGTTGSVQFDENDKTSGKDNYNLRKSEVQFDHPLKIELSYNSNPSYKDFSVLRFTDNTKYTEAYDDEYGESFKIGNANVYLPNVATYSPKDTSDVYYNNLNVFDSSMSIPIRVWTQYPSYKQEQYTLNFNGIETWEENNKCVILRDTLNQVTQKLDRNNYDYTYYANDQLTDPYLFLDYLVPLDVATENVTCFGYNDGEAIVNGLGTGTHDYIWVDMNNNILKSEKDVTGPSSMNDLAPGEYLIWVSDNGQCGTVGATITISEPEPIIADFTSDVDTVYMNANTTIYFDNASINADTYSWDFGDGNTSNMASPAHTYTEGGTFTVSLVAITGVCSDTLSKVVQVIDNVGIEDELSTSEEIRIYQINNETFVEFNFDVAKNATILMHDVLARETIEPMQLQKVKTKKVRLNIPADVFGVYTISVVTDDNKVSKKIYYAQK